jgi:hypothetical protein
MPHNRRTGGGINCDLDHSKVSVTVHGMAKPQDAGNFSAKMKTNDILI